MELGFVNEELRGFGLVVACGTQVASGEGCRYTYLTAQMLSEYSQCMLKPIPSQIPQAPVCNVSEIYDVVDVAHILLGHITCEEVCTLEVAGTPLFDTELELNL